MKESTLKTICELAGKHYIPDCPKIESNEICHNTTFCRKQHGCRPCKLTLEILVLAMWAINKDSSIKMSICYLSDGNIRYYVTEKDNNGRNIAGTPFEICRFEDNEQKALEKAVVYCVENKK